MTAMSARSYGYRINVIDPDRDCPAAYVADHCIAASFNDVEALRDLLLDYLTPAQPGHIDWPDG